MKKGIRLMVEFNICLQLESKGIFGTGSSSTDVCVCYGPKIVLFASDEDKGSLRIE